MEEIKALFEKQPWPVTVEPVKNGEFDILIRFDKEAEDPYSVSYTHLTKDATSVITVFYRKITQILNFSMHKREEPYASI